MSPLADRARALLAEADGPAVPDGREPASVALQPSDGELWTMYDEMRGEPGDWAWVRDFARAVLARWGRPTPQPPADGEVAELVEFLREQVHACLQAPWTPGVKHFGRAAFLLEQRHPAPVPVSERWPEFSDCDPQERVWAYHLVLDHWKLSRINWSVHTHWLPAHALPTPEATND